MYRLVFLTGKFKGKRLAIEEKSVKAGRDPDCVIRLPDDEASRQHALFEQREDGVYVKDLGSTNRILVNDAPTQEARLNHGDRIELGNTLLQFQRITHADAGTGRRISHTQTVTGATVAVIILLQIAFLLFLVARHKDLTSIPEAAPTNVPVPLLVEKIELASMETDDEEATFAQAESLLQRREEEIRQAQAQPPPEPGPDDEVMQDLRQLREEVAGLREQLGVPAPVEPEIEQPAPEPPPAEPEPAPAPPVEEDPLTVRAQAMLADALADIARLNLVQADEKLARIQLMAPDFLPAYIERARLHEQRGQLKQAGEQWAEVLNRSMGTPLYEQAAAERIRIARTEAAARVAAPPETRGAKPEGRLERRIRITDIQQERFPKNEQFEEMRLLRIILKPRAGERNVDAYHIEVVVTFFDENTETREVRPTRAVVPKEPLRVDGEWRPNQERTLTAAYIVPRGLREEEFAKHEERMLYMGYVVQVYYRQELQDVEARPKTLLDKVDSIPSPFHKPPDTAPPPPPAGN
ncbi:MAG: Glycogen accumulation regulator GarA [Verrucomicrobia bacterium ADurb.Bin345]|nr:MAG: Glycogen accumulation regulator GarA [Verrucomicrobia bacterium ADurb.Bin345]